MALQPEDVNEYLARITTAAQPRKNFELELRLGNYREHFFPGVSIADFYRIKKTLVRDPSYQAIPRREIEDRWKGDIRQVVTGGEIYFEHKEKRSEWNLDFTNHRMRLALAHEQRIASPPNFHSQGIRKKTRWSFEHQEYRIDLTVVHDQTPVYEVELEFGEIAPWTMPKILEYGRILLRLWQDTPIPIREDERQLIIGTIQDLLHKRSYQPNILPNFESKPLQLKLGDLLNARTSLDHYAVTAKADGERRFLFFLPGAGIYLIQSNADAIQKISTLTEGFETSLIDGELLGTQYPRIFLAFDALYLQGDDIMESPLEERLQLLRTHTEEITQMVQEFLCYAVKGHFWHHNTYSYNDALLSQPFSVPTDGLVFTPVNTPYSSQEQPILKWKPPLKLTIDFRFAATKNPAVFQLYIQEKGHPLPFKGSREFPFKGFITVDPPQLDERPIGDGAIIECSWDGTTFIPVRWRDDKTVPNVKRAAESTWLGIQKPISPDMIRGRTTRLARKFYNQAKLGMLTKYIRRATSLLDIGSGQGGDIMKWKELRVRVTAVEPNEVNRAELIRRMHEHQYDVTVIPRPVEELPQPFTQFDAATLFFVLTFFTDTPHHLEQLAYVLSNSIRPGGLLIGITYDGDTIADILRGRSALITPGYTFEKRYFDDLRVGYGKEIRIDFPDTMVRDQVEYLVDFKSLVECFARYNFTLEHQEMIHPNFLLSPDEGLFAGLGRAFVFRRNNEQAPPAPVAPTQIVVSASKKRNMVLPTAMSKLPHKPAEPTAKPLRKPIPLRMLPMDEQAPFRLTDSRDDLVRIGTIPDGSCFYHSILRAILDKYQKAHKKTRVKQAQTLRGLIADACTYEKFMELGGGQTAMLKTQEWVRPKLKKLYHDEDTLTTAIGKVRSENYQVWCESLRGVLPEYFPQLHEKRLLKLLDEAPLHAYKEFQDEMLTEDEWAGIDMAELASEVHGIDIYFVDSLTRAPYKTATDCSELYHRRPSVIILYLEAAGHFELIGRKNVDGSIVTVFDPDDPLIKHMYDILRG